MADKLITLTPALRHNTKDARLWTPLANGRVQCELSPKQCRIPVGGLGFCGVRYNDGGTLKTLNYGKSVPVTEEKIESEAVYNYLPGSPILSLGNIGCMFKCDFCQNWQTSQARLVRDKDVSTYTPEQIVDYALRHGIGTLSWTYNDPVVWHEFVMDTARLARQAGLRNLYKSAFSITPVAISELLEVIDIFSISLKSLDPVYYQKHALGTMQPVLDGIVQVHQARPNGVRPHLEISNLCVTGRNDNLTETRKVAQWMLDNLGTDVPLHYVRFHPDYLYTHVGRTDIGFLEQARQQALDMGIQYVYLGNTPNTTSVDTFCPQCHAVAVQRSGDTMTTTVAHAANGQVQCKQCGHGMPLVIAAAVPERVRDAGLPSKEAQVVDHVFRPGIEAIHVEQAQEREVRYALLDSEGQVVREGASSCLRFLIARSGKKAVLLRLQTDTQAPLQLFEVYDRAHFPTVSAQESVVGSADTPPAPFTPE
jgi:pyruvate formate lyase activating enzyme